MDTATTVTVAIVTGLMTGIGSSLIAARVAIGDRRTRLQIAKEDREGAQRRSACIDLESQRILQTEQVRAAYNEMRGVLTTKTTFPSVPERNLITEAGISLILSESIKTAVDDLNAAYESFAVQLSDHKSLPADPDRTDSWKQVRAAHELYEEKAEELRTLLRKEMDTYPAS